MRASLCFVPLGAVLMLTHPGSALASEPEDLSSIPDVSDPAIYGGSPVPAASG